MDRSLIALPLPEATEAIEAVGQTVSRVIATGPTGMGSSDALPRVIRERVTDEGIELTVAAPIPGPRRDEV